ncbi:MAG: hypothetical protein EXQ64_04265 [Ilumatobacteraceae bacterium]|nr:hypothetical protein [Ilumatobacteraceae bacterium]
MTENDNTQSTQEDMSAVADRLRWMARMESVRAFAQTQSAETAEFRLLAASLDRRVKLLEREVRVMRSSWTWRVGRAVLFPVTIARVIKNRLRQTH